MSEVLETKKVKKKRKTTEVIYEQTIHPIILFYSVTFNILLGYYCFVLNRIPFMLMIFLLAISGFVTYYNYYKRKIVITQNKFYTYRLGKKTISLSFSKDFLHIKYEKTKIGRLLNYGTILLVTQNNDYYKIHFVKEPEKVFFAAIEQYENVMQIINPEYEKQLNQSTVQNNDNDFEKIDK